LTTDAERRSVTAAALTAYGIEESDTGIRRDEVEWWAFFRTVSVSDRHRAAIHRSLTLAVRKMPHYSKSVGFHFTNQFSLVMIPNW
jgi:hypothetical protein